MEGGLFLDVRKNGGRYWRMKYRYGGRERLLAFGLYPEVSLAEARRRRESARAKLRDGVDPNEAKRRERIATATRLTNSFEAVCREWIAVRGIRWTERHLKNLIAQMERDAFPKLGPRPVTALTPTEILPVLREVESRGSLDSAGRLLQRMRMALNYAVATGRIESNPVRDLAGHLRRPRADTMRPFPGHVYLTSARRWRHTPEIPRRASHCI